MELMETILNRKSIRKYSGEEVSDVALHDIIQAGLLAPSSRNLRPVELITVSDKAVLKQLARAKTAGSGMLEGASCAVVVAGNSEKSDVWVEDCSIAMTYMMLRATELGVANCWVQCRNRISQQKKGEPLSEIVEDAPRSKTAEPSENLVAQRIANNANDKDNLSSDEFIKQLLGIPDNYSVLAILSLGMTDEAPKPHTKDETDFSKVHNNSYKAR